MFPFLMKTSAVWLREATAIYYIPNEFALYIPMQNVPINETTTTYFQQNLLNNTSKIM